MSAKFHTIVKQWGLVSGVRQVNSDLITISAPPSPFAPQTRKGRLILLVETEGDLARGREACQLVATTLHDTFYADGSLSITSSLRRAIRAANAALYRYNFEAPAHKHAHVGVTCAVIHGRDLFLTQVPPAQAYLASAGKLRAIPLPLSWGPNMDGAALLRQGALGTSLGSEPEFSRAVLQPGDTLVLCSSNIAQLLGKRQAEELFCYNDAETIAETLYRCCREAGLPEAHAAVIEIVDRPAPAEQPAPPPPAPPQHQPEPPRSGWLARLRRQPAPTPASMPAHEPPPTPAATPPAPPTAAPVPEHPPATPQVAVAARPTPELLPVAEPWPLPPSAFLGEGEYGGTTRPPAVQRRAPVIDLSDNTGLPVDFAALPPKPTPPPPTPLERLTLPLRRLMAELLSGMANLPRRTARPAERLPAQGLRLKGLTYRRRRPPLPWFNILLIVGIVALLIVIGIQQNRRRDQAQIEAALNQVASAVSTALRSDDPQAAQQLLARAEQALSPGGAVGTLIQSGLITTTKPLVWSRYLEVRRGYDQAMATINRIGFLDELETVATLPGAEGLIERVVIGSTATSSDTPPVFYLDRGNGLLYEAGRSEPLLRQELEIGPFVTGPIRDMLWREGNIIAFDRGDQLFPIYHVYLRSGQDWLANQLNKTEHMEPADGDLPMATFGGHLYVWDARERQIWRYYSGMYADMPQPWITNAGGANLEQVVDIEIDGRIWLLNRDGSILVFEGGQLVKQLPPPQLSVPLGTISRFVVTADVLSADGLTVEQPGSIYLLDLRNERILQLSKEDGSLIQQIQARTRGPLNQVSDLAVDEARRTIYLANGPRVLRAALPAPPAPPAEERATATPAP